MYMYVYICVLMVAGRSARRGIGQGGAGARRRALPARGWRTAARGRLSVWRQVYTESVFGRPEGAQPPNTPGGNTTRGETAHGETHPPTCIIDVNANLTPTPDESLIPSSIVLFASGGQLPCQLVQLGDARAQNRPRPGEHPRTGICLYISIFICVCVCMSTIFVHAYTHT